MARTGETITFIFTILFHYKFHPSITIKVLASRSPLILLLLFSWAHGHNYLYLCQIINVINNGNNIIIILLYDVIMIIRINNN